MAVQRWKYAGSLVEYDLTEEQKDEVYSRVLDFLPAQRDVYTREDGERFELLFTLNRTTSTAWNIADGVRNRATSKNYGLTLVRFGDDPADITLFLGDEFGVDQYDTEIKFYHQNNPASIYYLDELFN